MAPAGEKETDPRPYRGDWGLPAVGPENEVLDVEGGPLQVFRESLLASELGGDLGFTVGGHLRLLPWYRVSAVNPVEKSKGKSVEVEEDETSSTTNTTNNELSREGRRVPTAYPMPLCGPTPSPCGPSSVASAGAGASASSGPSSSTSANNTGPVSSSTSWNAGPYREVPRPPSPVVRRAAETYDAMIGNAPPSTNANPAQNSSEVEAFANATVVGPAREQGPPAAANPPNARQQPQNNVRVSSSPPQDPSSTEPRAEEWAGETAVTIRWDCLSCEEGLFHSPLFEKSGKIVFPPYSDDRVTPEEQIALLIQDMTPTTFGYELPPACFSTSFSPHESGIIDLITQSLVATWSSPENDRCKRPEGRSIEVFLESLQVHCPDSVRNKDPRFRDEKVRERLSKPQESPSWQGQLGKLVVTLPFVPFEGGELSVYPPQLLDLDKEESPVVYDKVELFTLEESSEPKVSNPVELSSPGGSKNRIPDPPSCPVFNLHWAAWHDGCRASVAPVTQGYRVSLVYDLTRVRGNPLMGSSLTALRLLDLPTTLPLYRLVTDMLKSDKAWQPTGGYLGFMLVNAYPHGSSGAEELGFKLELSLRGVDFLMYHIMTEALRNLKDSRGSRFEPLEVQFRPVIRDARVDIGAKKHPLEVLVNDFVAQKKREKAAAEDLKRRKAEMRRQRKEEAKRKLKQKRLEEEQLAKQEEDRRRLEQERLEKEKVEQERLAQEERERLAREEQERAVVEEQNSMGIGRGETQAKSKATAQSKGKGEQREVVESDEGEGEGEEGNIPTPQEQPKPHRTSLRSATSQETTAGSYPQTNIAVRRSTKRFRFADDITELDPGQQNREAGVEKQQTREASNPNTDDRQKENIRPRSSPNREAAMTRRRKFPPVSRFTGDEPGESSRPAARRHQPALTLVQSDSTLYQFANPTNLFPGDEPREPSRSQRQRQSLDYTADQWADLARSVSKTNEALGWRPEPIDVSELGLGTPFSLPQPANVNPQNAPAATMEDGSCVDWDDDCFPPVIGKNYKRAATKAWAHATNDPVEMKDFLDAWAGKPSPDQGSGTTDTSKGYYIDFEEVHWLNQWGHEEVSLINTMYTPKGPGPRVLRSCLAMIVKVPPGGIIPAKEGNRSM